VLRNEAEEKKLPGDISASSEKKAPGEHTGGSHEQRRRKPEVAASPEYVNDQKYLV